MRRSVPHPTRLVLINLIMSRVRCDLKDLPAGFVGPHPACSNCKERGIKCVLVVNVQLIPFDNHNLVLSEMNLLM